MTDEVMEFGEYIKHLRSKKRLSTRALGRKLGVSHGYLSNVESGRQEKMSLYRIQLLAENLCEKGGMRDLYDNLCLKAGLIPGDIGEMVMDKRMFKIVRKAAELEDKDLSNLVHSVNNYVYERSKTVRDETPKRESSVMEIERLPIVAPSPPKESQPPTHTIFEPTPGETAYRNPDMVVQREEVIKREEVAKTPSDFDTSKMRLKVTERHNNPPGADAGIYAKPDVPEILDLTPEQRLEISRYAAKNKRVPSGKFTEAVLEEHGNWLYGMEDFLEEAVHKKALAALWGGS